MKKHMGFIMVGMLALAALGFTACGLGEEGEYIITFENRTSYETTVNCPKGTPPEITLKGVTKGAAGTTDKVTFPSSRISYEWYNEGKDTGLVEAKRVGFRIIFQDKYDD